MVRLREIMTRDLVTLSPETSVRDAMETLAAKHVSGAPVVAGTKVVGVASASDLMQFASELRDQDDREESAEMLDGEAQGNKWDANDESTSAFFVELWSDGESDVTERMENFDQPWWSVLGSHDVSEAMSRAIRSLPPDTPVDEAAAYLRENKIHRVLVMDGDRLLGLVSTSDVANAVANHGVSTG